VSATATARIADKRELILDAALELFAERGFHGTAVPLVAERAKVGAGTLYRYFESKEALVNALYQREKAAFGLEFARGFDPSLPAREQFRRMWSRLWEFTRQNPESIRFLDLHHHQSYLDAESQATEARVMQPILEFVQRAQADQALKAMPPVALISLVYGAFLGLAKADWQGHLELSDDTLAKAEACVWEAIRV
jgi:TetR/AcrR family transcriptional regulator, repressor of fatR-cypB operon